MSGQVMIAWRASAGQADVPAGVVQWQNVSFPS
jgi:hypothetical protein